MQLPSTTNQQIKLYQIFFPGRMTRRIIVRYFFTVAVVNPALFNIPLNVVAHNAGVAYHVCYVSMRAQSGTRWVALPQLL